ncbi:MAG: hypothetical protein CMH83_00965 [Nocardioides sp.]|nr:hypothetical protein [Nocardioides sp.]
MKAFWIYTGMRLGLFLVTWAAVTGAWLLIDGTVAVGVTFLIALVVSGIGSYFVLNGPRQRLAEHVQERASKASARFEEMKAKEDVD